jgi:hypothetical protein
MTKAKLENLKKYVSFLKNKLISPVSDKHKDNIKNYHDFLILEVKKTESKIAANIENIK